MILIFSFFWLFVAGAGLLKNNRKNITGFCVLVLIALLMAFNTHNPDYSTFESIYNDINNTSQLDHGNDFLYLLTNHIGAFLGLNFKEFRCIYICICLLSYFSFIKKHTRFVPLCLILYFFTGGILDYIQLRQFGAMAISIWLIDVAMNKQLNRRVLKAFIILALAAGFHKSVLLYLIILPYFFVDRNKLKRIYGIAFLILLAVIFLGLRSSIVYILMSKFAGEGTASYYLISRHYIDELPKIILDIIIQNGLLIIIMFIRYRNCIKDKGEIDKITAVLAIDLLVTALMPLNILSIQFKRLARITLLPSFSAVIPDDWESRPGVVKKIDIMIIILLIVYVYLYYKLTIAANPNILTDLFNYFNK